MGHLKFKETAIAEGPRDALVSTNSATIVWHYLRDPTFSHFDTIPECGRYTQRKKWTDTQRRHIPRLA